MKEYIAKDELIKRKRDINLANTPWNFIDDAPTVTKADIRAEAIEEFAHELKETFNSEFPLDFISTEPFFTLDDVRGIVDRVMREKE